MSARRYLFPTRGNGNANRDNRGKDVRRMLGKLLLRFRVTLRRVNDRENSDILGGDGQANAPRKPAAQQRFCPVDSAEQVHGLIMHAVNASKQTTCYVTSRRIIQLKMGFGIDSELASVFKDSPVVLSGGRARAGAPSDGNKIRQDRTV